MQLTEDDLKIIKFQEDCYLSLKNDHYINTQLNDHTRSLYSQLSELTQQSTEFRQDNQQLIEQISNLEFLVKNHAQANKKLVDIKMPYFAWFSFIENHIVKYYFLADHTYSFGDKNYQVLNWRSSPLSVLFFKYEAGESFFEEIAGKERQGKITQRFFLNFEKFKLSSIIGKKCTLSRHTQSWHKQIITNTNLKVLNSAVRPDKIAQSIALALGMYAKRKFKFLPNLLLSFEQWQAVIDDKHNISLIYGIAGSGKTTTALHRVYFLYSLAKSENYNFNAGIFCIRQSLKNYILDTVEISTLPGIAVFVFNDYLKNIALGLFGSKLKFSNTNVNLAAVSNFKKSSHLKAAFDLYIKDQSLKFNQQVDALLSEFSTAPNKLIDLKTDYLIQSICKLDIFLNSADFKKLAAKPQLKLKQLALDWINEDLAIVNHASLLIYMWHNFFSNFDIIDNILNRLLQDGIISDKQPVNLYFREHYLLREKHLLAEKFVTAKNKNFNQPNPNLKKDLLPAQGKEYNADFYLDDEDLAMLIYAYQQLVSPIKKDTKILNFNCLMIDEVQELSLIEISIMHQLLHPAGKMILCGDLNQKTAAYGGLDNWDEVKELFIDRVYLTSSLNVSYRTTHQITKFAHDILGSVDKSLSSGIALKNGPPVECRHFNFAGHMYIHTAEMLKNIALSNDKASVALLCLNDDIAKAVYENLLYLDVSRIHFAYEGDFNLAAGINVATIYDSKGLEFDCVFLFDINYKDYPDKAFVRRMLYMAATRACFSLHVYALYSISPVLNNELFTEYHTTVAS